MSHRSVEDGKLMAVIGDEDTCIGFLLGGIGEINEQRQSNFMVVEKDTSTTEIDDCFKRFVARNDIAIIMINQIYADRIRSTIDKHLLPVPTVLEIPSKEQAYDSSKDSILKRAQGILKPAGRHRQFQKF
ncbi:V-type proton ATPase subunit F [Drosophila innubila]|uniref:V-type proton ATPase subunit F n=1 Tax=Drosophila innubila TaxID=198719 RepID=UPI00148DCCBC|nr:V-type proton ATPase subunit F [Drosophila innubila]